MILALLIIFLTDPVFRYWAGSLALHNLDGYGVDAFLQISKLGNKNEQLTTRASMDSV